jgi:hypothetical protein
LKYQYILKKNEEQVGKIGTVWWGEQRKKRTKDNIKKQERINKWQEYVFTYQ